MPSTFGDFTTKTTFSPTDILVGYDSTGLGGEKKWEYNALFNALSSNLTVNYFNTTTTVISSLEVSGFVTETKASPSISANTLTLNLKSATFFSVNLNSAVNTLTLTNVPASPKVYSFTLQLIADGTARTVTWPASFRWSAGTPPTITSTLNKVDTFTFITHDGGTNWFAYTSDQNQ